VQSGAVVKGFDVIEDGGTGVSMAGEVVVINEFVFESAPKGLDEGVVVAVAFAAHGREEAVLREEEKGSVLFSCICLVAGGILVAGGAKSPSRISGCRLPRDVPWGSAGEYF
jgi:hypothetical protein